MPVYTQQFACDDHAPRLARGWAADIVRGVTPPDGFWLHDLVHDVVLCASELVTNSLINNSTAMTVRISVEPGVLRLSLVDDCPILSDRRDSRFHAQGMGLRLIQAASASSGITPLGVGREQWVLFRAGMADDCARPSLVC